MVEKYGTDKSGVRLQLLVGICRRRKVRRSEQISGLDINSRQHLAGEYPVGIGGIRQQAVGVDSREMLGDNRVFNQALGLNQGL